MNRKTTPVLVIAILCGLGAMVASSRMLAGGTAPAAESQQIVLAARDILAEEVLKPDMVKLETVARSAVPPGAFTSFREVADRWVQVKVFDGEPIVDRKLAPKGTPTGLVALIPKGKRAFAINVNEQTGVSGFIRPEHHVDVFQATTAANGEPGRAIPVLQDLLVLASGTSIQSTPDKAVQARTVTVAVTVEEASILTMAQARGGPLSLALRAMNDHEKADIPEPPPAEPAPKVAPAPPPEPVEPKEPPKPLVASLAPEEEPAPRHVTIYRGGKPPERIRVDKSPDEAEEGGLGFPSPAELASAPPQPPIQGPQQVPAQPPQ
jgi:pilus assembly protein CpaB